MDDANDDDGNHGDDDGDHSDDDNCTPSPSAPFTLDLDFWSFFHDCNSFRN